MLKNIKKCLAFAEKNAILLIERKNKVKKNLKKEEKWN